MAESNSNLSQAPIMSAAPRIESCAKTTRYEFRNVRDLITCLNDGTFQFVIDIYDAKYASEGKFYVNLRGKFSDRAAGSIHFGLMRKSVDIRVEEGKRKLGYDFLQRDDDNYLMRRENEETQADFDELLAHYQDKLIAAVKAYYSSDTVISVFSPKRLKMAIPSENSVTKVSAEGEEEIIPTFVLTEHIKKQGKLMVRFSSMWAMEQRKIDHMLIGFTYAMDKFKFLTDEQKKSALLDKGIAKRKRETEEAKKVKKDRREETA